MKFSSDKIATERNLWKKVFGNFWLQSIKTSKKVFRLIKVLPIMKFLLVFFIDADQQLRLLLSQKSNKASQKDCQSSYELFPWKPCFWQQKSLTVASCKSLKLLKTTEATIHICLQKQQMSWKFMKILPKISMAKCIESLTTTPGLGY